MFAGKSGKVLVWVRVVLLELFDNILADIGVVLFDLLGPVMSGQPLLRSETRLAYTLSWSSGGIWALSPRSRKSCWTKEVMSRPAIGTCLIDEPITYPSA